METIGFDLDGVLYDFHVAAYTELVAFHGLDVSFNIFWDDYQSYYSEKFFSNFVKISILYNRLTPITGSVDTLNYLANKYNICYITSRPDDVVNITKYWLKYYNFPNYDNIEFSTDKSIEIRQHNCKYFIEDMWKQETVNKLAKITNLILVSKIHNRNIYGVPRISSVTELNYLL